MTRIATLPLALMLLTTALAGCLDGTEPIDTSELDENTSQNSADIATLNEELEAFSNSLDTDLALIEALETRIGALETESEDNAGEIASVRDDLKNEDIVVVTGAGNETWNGIYERVGDDCGGYGDGCRNNYQMPDTNQHIFTNNDGFWNLDEGSVGTDYRAPADVEERTPPSDGWEVFDDGVEPAPSVIWINSHNEDIATLKDEIDTIMDILDVDLQELDAIIDVLNADLMAIEALEAELEANLTALAADIETAEADLEYVDAQLADLDVRILTLENGIAALEGEVSTLENAIADITQTLDEHAADIQAL